MAFNLKKVLKALLLSSGQPLAVKDIQAAFTRFHDSAFAAASAERPADGVEAGGEGPAVGEGATAAGAGPANEGVATISSPPVEELAEVLAENPVEDPELYSDVPALVTAAQIREAMDAIAVDLRVDDEGLLLIEGNAGYRLVTHPRFARWVRILRQEPPPVKLSQSSIETLAVIAYRQPVTRTEIETIRGVSAEAGINKLLERDLIYIVGRADTPGRPIQYGTADQFLEFVGIKSLDEMPASDVLSSRQIDEWLKSSSSAHMPTDTDMGLADEQLPLGAAVGEEAAAPTAPASEPPAAVEANPPAQT